MYQVLGFQRCLGYLLFLCLFFFVGLGFFFPPSELGDYWSLAKLAVATTLLLLIGLGQTPLFPWICKLPRVGNYFPPIDGEWQVIMRSNWNILRQLVGEDKGDALFKKEGKVTITSRLFSVRIKFQSNDEYSKSTTTMVGVRRDPEHGTIELNYCYHNVTRNPEVTDSGCHYGAARVEVHEKNGLVSLEGEYWTNRNWNKGLNTAGLIAFERL
ncbi:hypothetical protein ACOJCM_12225 [Billgrantia sp. LNSP4103-1]|uniref:Cap15 family cyclic dinucleotide receptor domain-containing protein n=1 Tax=Billgrantia sp. LNSP4103-1 TaxID=3410266 RepID=UPI00403F9073